MPPPGSICRRRLSSEKYKPPEEAIARPNGDVTAVTREVVPAAGSMRTIRPPLSATTRCPSISVTSCPGKLKRSGGATTTTMCVRTLLRTPVGPTVWTRRTCRPSVSRFE